MALIPDHAQLMMGFTSTQTAALGPDNIPSFETLPGVTNQFPSGYFASGGAMHLSHIEEDLEKWYGIEGGYGAQVARMFFPKTDVPRNPMTVTLPNGPGNVATQAQLLDRLALMLHSEYPTGRTTSSRLVPTDPSPW